MRAVAQSVEQQIDIGVLIRNAASQAPPPSPNLNLGGRGPGVYVSTSSPSGPYACSHLRCTDKAWGCRFSVLYLPFRLYLARPGRQVSYSVSLGFEEGNIGSSFVLKALLLSVSSEWGVCVRIYMHACVYGLGVGQLGQSFLSPSLPSLMR